MRFVSASSLQRRPALPPGGELADNAENLFQISPDIGRQHRQISSHLLCYGVSHPLTSRSSQYARPCAPSAVGVSIGINLPAYPRLVPVPGYPVYYAPSVDSNYFFYDGLYWVFDGDNWYESRWYNGPWSLVEPDAVPIFLLGLFQTTQPVESDWNRYADPEMAVATFSAVNDARASGTFSYITEFASFAEICAVIAVFLMLTTDSRIIGWLWNSGILIMALGAIMASGSRGPAAVFG